MKNWTKQMPIALLLFLGISFGKAQETISLKQAIEFALKNKADAIKAQNAVTNADNLIMESKSQAYPHLNASGNLTYNPMIQQVALPGELAGEPGKTLMVPLGQKWSSMMGVQLQQKLFDAQVFIGLKAAQTSKEFYQINKQLTDEQLTERVATAYYQVFSQKQKLETLDSSYASTAKIRNVIKSLFDNGLAKKIDLDRTNVNLTNIKTTQIQLQNAVTQSENALKFFMGMPIQNQIILTRGDLAINPPLLENQLNTENLTEVQLLNKRKKLLEYNVQVNKAAFYPNLSLVGNYAWQGFGDKFVIGGNKNQGVFWSDFANIGLQLNIPIFNGFAIKAKVNEAKIDLLNVEQDLKDTQLSLDLQYQNAKSQIQNSLEAIKNQQANQELAQQVFENTQNNYRFGLANLTDLLDAENSLVQAKNNLTNALLDFKIAQIQYYKATGQLSKLTN